MISEYFTSTPRLRDREAEALQTEAQASKILSPGTGLPNTSPKNSVGYSGVSLAHDSSHPYTLKQTAMATESVTLTSHRQERHPDSKEVCPITCDVQPSRMSSNVCLSVTSKTHSNSVKPHLHSSITPMLWSVCESAQTPPCHTHTR